MCCHAHLLPRPRAQLDSAAAHSLPWRGQTIRHLTAHTIDGVLQLLQFVLNRLCSRHFIKVVHSVEILGLLDGVESYEVPEGWIVPQSVWMESSRRVVLDEVGPALRKKNRIWWKYNTTTNTCRI